MKSTGIVRKIDELGRVVILKVFFRNFFIWLFFNKENF